LRRDDRSSQLQGARLFLSGEIGHGRAPAVSELQSGDLVGGVASDVQLVTSPEQPVAEEQISTVHRDLRYLAGGDVDSEGRAGIRLHRQQRRPVG
jgi:hypothetical protein